MEMTFWLTFACTALAVPQTTFAAQRPQESSQANTSNTIAQWPSHVPRNPFGVTRLEAKLKKIRTIGLLREINRLLDEQHLSPIKGVVPSTHLHHAISTENMTLARLLIEYNADVNARNNQGESPLFSALFTNNLALVHLLLEHRANVNDVCDNSQDSYGFTPLSWAAAASRLEIVRLLLDHNADHLIFKDSDVPSDLHADQMPANVNARCNDGASPLHLAASNNRTEVSRLLLDRGADVNARDNQGNTPLCANALNDHPETVRLLLDRGADVNAKDNQGRTPLHRVRYDGIKSILTEHGAV